MTNATTPRTAADRKAAYERAIALLAEKGYTFGVGGKLAHWHPDWKVREFRYDDETAPRGFRIVTRNRLLALAAMGDVDAWMAENRTSEKLAKV